jgi:CHAT domain-containing protein/tetratricopeptide (TPR) repeat protein
MNAALRTWLGIDTPRKARQFLETHQELLAVGASLTEQSLSLLQESDEQTLPSGVRDAALWRERLFVLRDIRKRGGTLQALRAAYVNLYGGLTLDLPPWLEQQEDALRARHSGQPAAARVAVLREALATAGQQPDLAQEIRADLSLLLREALKDQQGSEPPASQAAQRACLEQALTVYTYAAYPYQYARIQGNLGNMYRQQHQPAQALACYLQARQVFTREDFPILYARTSTNLGRSYAELAEGEAGVNQEQAITCYEQALDVFTQDAFPACFATLQYYLSCAYHDRLQGERSANRARAVACAERALQIFTPHAFPKDHASAQWALANAYDTWPEEGQESNQQARTDEAIACYQRALQFFTAEQFPSEYARLQYRMGLASKYRPAEPSQVHLEQAIVCFQACLRIYTLAAFPCDYAIASLRLGDCYRELRSGDRAANLEQAISCYQQSLQVFTRERYPADYGIVCTNLSATYALRLCGQRQANLEEAIACSIQALTVFPRAQSPREHARTRYNLGVFYRERISGERRSNLELAIEHLESALVLYQADHLSKEIALCSLALGVSYFDRVEGERRRNLETALARYTDALQIYVPEQFPVEYARTKNNLCVLYTERIAGNRSVNLEEAIGHARQALAFCPREHVPREHAALWLSLGVAYRERLVGEKRENLEEALACYTRALQVYTRDVFPVEYARVQNNISSLYQERLMGKRAANLEAALVHCRAALEVSTREAFPVEYAMVQNNAGTIYYRRAERTYGIERLSAQEEAIACYRRALQVFTRENQPGDYARAQTNLGNIFWLREEGERQTNQEEAIACFQRALQVFTLERFPVDYARVYNSLGVVYRARLAGEQEENILRSRACYSRALQVYTRETFPLHYRMTLLNLAYTEMSQGRWAEAHDAYRRALDTEDTLLALGAGVAGREAVLQEGRSATLGDSVALIRLGRLAEAALVLEHGRVRGLSEAIALDTAHPDLVRQPERRARYARARQDLKDAQKTLLALHQERSDSEEFRLLDLERTHSYHEARQVFDALVEEIRQAGDPDDFFVTSVRGETILQAAEQCAERHALVYLAATDWGGFALLASAFPLAGSEGQRFAVLDLPHLTVALVHELIESRIQYNQSSGIVGGFLWAQENNGFQLLAAGSAEQTFREKADAFQRICTLAAKSSMLDLAAREVLAMPACARIIDRPLHQLDAWELSALQSTLGHFFLRYELQRCLQTLAEVAMVPLTDWLQHKGVQSLTLIPCEMLATFPLSIVEGAPGTLVNTCFATSVAPGARLLVHHAHKGQAITTRAGVYTLGNPETGSRSLVWGEAEALTLAKIARALHLPTRVRIQQQATRAWLIEILQRGSVVVASCHGVFDTEEPLQSGLRLASNERLTLRQVLSNEVNLHGLQLLILSSCQTAIVDLRGISDEVYSLPAGMLQAGAKAVLASLWSVDDRATYLLMVRFAQEWFPSLHEVPPAVALARAQTWLRTVTNQDLQVWQAQAFTEKGPRGDVLQTVPAFSEEQENPLSALHNDLQAALAVRTDRYEPGEAVRYLRHDARQQDPAARPYEHPVYWAGFQVTGW